MSKKAYDDLDNEFGIFEESEEPVEIEVVKETPKDIKKIKKEEPTDDRSKDYNYSRAQLYDIVEKMQESINDAMDVAHESQHPRAYEVVFQGAKAAADVVDKIADLHKKMKDLEDRRGQGSAERIPVIQTFLCQVLHRISLRC